MGRFVWLLSEWEYPMFAPRHLLPKHQTNLQVKAPPALLAGSGVCKPDGSMGVYFPRQPFPSPRRNKSELAALTLLGE